jgi:hypothetical protein
MPAVQATGQHGSKKSPIDRLERIRIAAAYLGLARAAHMETTGFAPARLTPNDKTGRLRD